MDLTEVLRKSKVVMNKSKDMPRGQRGLLDDNALPNISESSNNAPIFSEMVASRSKMPKEIIEAMRQSSSEPRSFLDMVDTEELIQENELSKKKQVIKEATPQVQVSTSIDYSMIRMMIEETMRKYMGSLKKTIINENKGNGLQLMTQKGNTFRFVTEDGKIYEGKLTYKGNINDK